MMKRMLMFAAAMLTLSAGFAYAAIPNTSDYLHKTTPMITGTVFSVDDQQIVVDTDQGKQVTMVMDSHTMLPTDLAPGMLMRAEFHVMENGQYYVNRITPIRDAKQSSRSDAYWHRRGNDLDLARTPSALTYERSTANAPAAAVEQPSAVEAPVPAVQANESPVATTASDAPETLPQTASGAPLLALLGVLAMLGAGTLMFARGRSRV
jgi:LPXTG-motif cell wall-anchored protein